MELRSNIRLLNYTRKFLLGDTEGILPYAVQPQKPDAQGAAPAPLPRCTPQEAGVPAGAQRGSGAGAAPGASGFCGCTA